MSFGAVATIGAIGAGIGALSGGYSLLKGAQQQKAANAIHPTYSNYEASPYASQQLAAAQQLYNGRMAGAADEQRNIAAAQSNTNAAAQRAATNSGQALALAAAGQGQAESAYNKLGQQEAQNKQNLVQNLNQAYAANISEGDKVYQSQLNKYQLDLNRQAQLAGAAASNISNGINGIGSSVLGFGNFLSNI